MSIEYRLVTDGDYDHEALVDLIRETRPDEYVSVAELVDLDEMQQRAGRLHARWFAIQEGDLIGSGYCGERPWYEPGVLVTSIIVHPGHQQRGTGRALLQRVERLASAEGAVRLLTDTDESDARANRFLQRAGFYEVDRWWRSTLDLTRFDAVAWEGAIAGMAEQGIRLVTVAELRAAGGGWDRHLHRLYVELEQGVPSGVTITEVPFEDFAARSLGRELLADGFLVALDGDTMIGLTEPKLVDEDSAAISQDLTGVRAVYRRRGIATALKAAAATWAQEHGYRSMRTLIAQSNAPMLAVNTRLGYVSGHGQVEYAREL